jgi:hypothetical protein
VPSPSLRRVRNLVSTGQLRFFLLGQPGMGLPGRAPTGQAASITSWVRHTCTPIGVSDGALYRCGRATTARYDK